MIDTGQNPRSAAAGKTTLLDQIQDAAGQAGWWVIQEDGGAGRPLIARIIERGLTRLAEHQGPPRRRVSHVSFLDAGIGFEPSAAPASVTSLRDVLDATVAAERNGVLLTVDEVHHAPDAAVNELGNAAQHLHRNGLPLVLVLAGLPTPGRRKEPTFLSRAWQPPLDPLPDREVERGLVDTAATAGAGFEPLALRRAIDAVAGEPYLLQLVGYHALDHATTVTVTVDDVAAAVPVATATFRRAVTAQMVDAVSPSQRAFLACMVRLGTPTRLADVRAEHGWSQSQVGVLRHRLLDAGLLVAAGRGIVDFALPGIPDVLADEL